MGVPVALRDPAPGAGARAERAMLDVFLWMRVSHLAAGLVSLSVDRHRYRRPRLADLAWGLTVVESVWLARRCRRQGAYADPTVATVDAATGCVGLVACAAALEPDDQFGAANWMFPLTLFSAIGVSAGLARRWQSTTAATALMSTYALATRARTSGRIGPSVFGAFQYAGCFVGGDILIRRTRANAALIERLGQVAVECAERASAERERTRLHAQLHAGALETLDAVRASWSTDRSKARARAQREAIRLRRALRDDALADAAGGGAAGAVAPSLAEHFEAVVGELAPSGLSVDLLVDELGHSPTPERVAALGEALRAALENVAAHARVRRVVVRATDTDDGVEVIVRDQGVGCERREAPASVAGPLQRVGGQAAWWSEPGRGARVSLRVGS